MYGVQICYRYDNDSGFCFCSVMSNWEITLLFFTRPYCPSSYYHDFILILKAQLCFQPKVQPKHKSISGVILVLTGVENKLLEAWLETQREGAGDPLSSYSQIGSWWLLDFFLSKIVYYWALFIVPVYLCLNHESNHSLIGWPHKYNNNNYFFFFIFRITAKLKKRY